MSRVQIADFSLFCFLSVPQFEITVPFGLLGLWFGYCLYTLWVKFWFDLEEKVKKSRSLIVFVVRDGDTSW